MVLLAICTIILVNHTFASNNKPGSSVKLQTISQDTLIPKSFSQEKKQKAIQAIQKNIDTQNGYRIFVLSSDSEVSLKNKLGNEASLKVKKHQIHNLQEVVIDKKSALGKLLEQNMTGGKIISNIGWLEVVLPTVVKVDSEYVAGESLLNMWGITKIFADKYQYSLTKYPSVSIWVIDTGIDLNHNDLKSNLWTNKNEIAQDNKDNDNNGYVDDVYGYNFIGNNNNVQDDHGYGTHVAGVVWASVNGAWVFWVQSQAKLVGLKVLDASGYGTSYSVYDAIMYAANNNIPVINLSLWWDGDPSKSMICQAITYAKSKWTVAVVAAGNENTTVSNKVPAWCSDAITVSAVDSQLRKASFSNYGVWVDVAAPGVSIYSTYIGNKYATMNGTSMATPFVAWLVGAIVSTSQIDKNSIKNLLIANGDTFTSSVHMGTFINMNKVMDTLWVKQDHLVDEPVTQPENTLPTLDIEAIKKSPNNYDITAKAIDQDGFIKEYRFYENGVLKYQWTQNIYSIQISIDTTVKVEVIDDKGWLTSKEIKLIYEKPIIQNVLPVIKFSTSIVKKTTNRLSVWVSDSDGKIKNIQVYISGKLAREYNINRSSYSFTLDFKVGIYNEIYIKATDDKGWISENSIIVK